MKKAFTLVEIVIVIVLIGLVLAMVAKLGSGFSDKLRFANTKETLMQSVEHVIQESITTSDVRIGTGHSAYGHIFLTIPTSGNSVDRTYFSGDLINPVSRSTVIPNARLSTTGFALTLKPYGLGCEATSGTDFRLFRTTRSDYVACYEVDTATCKLREKACN